MIIDNENPGLRLVRKFMRAIRSAVRDHELHEVQCSLRLTAFGAVCWQGGAAVSTPTARSRPRQHQEDKPRGKFRGLVSESEHSGKRKAATSYGLVAVMQRGAERPSEAAPHLLLTGKNHV
jgi:hypothetical protein